ncbi:hypothetical protein M9H77_17687 [Catharanthus roseus]|uniref:Uncharacterized protein n=1 Tax=Catharanthus roseus TaxID=4058 RepID=A0ACC0B5B2_CATRO|nr:hypothetical protein M9H77_17687 [Catharanthus roseus]
MGARLFCNRALIWCLAGIDYEMPELGSDGLVLGIRTLSVEPHCCITRRSRAQQATKSCKVVDRITLYARVILETHDRRLLRISNIGFGQSKVDRRAMPITEEGMRLEFDPTGAFEKTLCQSWRRCRNKRAMPITEEGIWSLVGDIEFFLKLTSNCGKFRHPRGGKLSPDILDLLKLLAYQLALSSKLTGIHDVFHVPQLKKYQPALDYALTDSLPIYMHRILALDLHPDYYGGE